MYKYNMYTVYVIFAKGFKYSQILKEIPIRYKANGSIIAMKGNDPVMDYIDVTYEELLTLIEYIDKLDTRCISLEIEKN